MMTDFVDVEMTKSMHTFKWVHVLNHFGQALNRCVTYSAKTIHHSDETKIYNFGFFSQNDTSTNSEESLRVNK